jgi:hypothetical protein
MSENEGTHRIKCGHCKATHGDVDAVRFCGKVREQHARVAEPGLYRTADGTVYQVVWNKTRTHLYAKLVTWDAKKQRWNKVHEFAAITKLHKGMRMTPEEAAEMSRIKENVVCCCVCGRTLTNKVSQERGIGPICMGKV